MLVGTGTENLPGLKAIAAGREMNVKMSEDLPPGAVLLVTLETRKAVEGFGELL